MSAARCLVVCCVALLACSPAPESEGEEGGVTTDPSGGGVTTVDTEGTTDPNPTGPSSTSTSTTGEPPPPPILDFGGGSGGVGDSGDSCTTDDECIVDCYVIPFLGGYCGECNEDADCPDGGCSSPNPFDSTGSLCNMGELGAGCESSQACQGDLVCDTTLDLLGLIQIRSCGTCLTDADCPPDLLCVAQAELTEFTGVKSCMPPGSIGPDSYCELDGNGDQACQSGVCSAVDIMGLADIGACGDCRGDQDCGGGICVPGEFDLDTGGLTGSTCQ